MTEPLKSSYDEATDIVTIEGAGKMRANHAADRLAFKDNLRDAIIYITVFVALMVGVTWIIFA